MVHTPTHSLLPVAHTPCSSSSSSSSSSAQVFLWQFRVSELPRAVRRELGYSSGLMQVFVSAERVATSMDGGLTQKVLISSINKEGGVTSLGKLPATARGVTQTGLGGQRTGGRTSGAEHCSARPQPGWLSTAC